MKKLFAIGALLLGSFGTPETVSAQSKLYPQLFDLQDVTLDNSPFEQAMLLNDSILLEYDVNRLLTPFFRQAGIHTWEAQYPNFPNWGSGSFRLDGHVGGHYLSALALAYAASRNEATRKALLERLNYMVDKMEECQSVFDNNTEGLYGYIGGLPDNSVWTGIYRGNLTAYNNNRGNVPFYVMHKIYAGLRDAWLYAGSEKALKCFLKLCDWGVNLISRIPDSTVQSLLDTEHGGMNEMYADAYRLTGNEKFLTAAIRYSHQQMIDGMQTASPTFLNNKHANTQVPKYIGFARIAQEDHEDTDKALAARYRKAALNFWNDVVNNRTLALGGNSIDEHFLPADRCSGYITNPNGPESCNTNNMLKLTEDLFANAHEARYADFYEKALYNHILSTQNPHTGGYVYFTSMRPQHYRMYSQVNQGMWCCVGTGMENHSKYGEFIYAHSCAGTDTLFVNLFIPSRLAHERFALTQRTRFPYEPKTQLTVEQDGEYVLAIRHPEWCKQGFGLSINGKELADGSRPGSYTYLKQTWKKGDVIDVALPMQLTLEACPNYSGYVAFRYGPILLGAKTSTENLVGQFAGEGRMDHAPSQGSQLSLTSAPMLIGNRGSVIDSVYMVNADSLHFKIRSGLYNNDKFAGLVLQPFYTIHEARYMMYWNQLTQAEWDRIKDEVTAEEEAAQALNRRTLDFVSTGEQQSDAGHARQGEFGTGAYSGEFYIDAQSGKWFSYQLETRKETEHVSLMCRYHSADAGRVWTLYIDGKKLKTVTLGKKGVTGFYNVEYPVPADLLRKADGSPKDTITVKFVASGNTPTPGLYYLRLLKDYEPGTPYTFVNRQWISADANRVNSVEYLAGNIIKVNGKAGNNNIALQLDMRYSDSTYIKKEQKYLLVRGTSLKLGNGLSYLWWLNGTNKGSQVAPTYNVQGAEGHNYVIWDITRSGLNDYMDEDSIAISANGKNMITVFGLTSSATDRSAMIEDIAFYSPQQAVDAYPELSATLGVIPTVLSDARWQDQRKQGVLYNLKGQNMGTDTSAVRRQKEIYIRDHEKIIL